MQAFMRNDAGQTGRFDGDRFWARAATVGLSNRFGGNKRLSALYFGGPLALGAAWQQVEKGATVADTSSWQLAVCSWRAPTASRC